MSEPVTVVVGPPGRRATVDALRAVDGVGDVLDPEPEAMTAALTDAAVLVTYGWEDDWLDSGVRWIQSYSAGVEQFPIDRLGTAGVVLTSAVGIHGVQVSEHVFGLLLGMSRGIAAAARNQRDAIWEWPRVEDLADRTMAVLGLGAIGESVARKARAFGMSVIGTKRSPEGYEGSADEVLGPQDTLEVCRRADVVVAVLPDTAETTGIIGPAEFAAMDGGWFINVGRGSAVDEDALLEALESGTLRGAGLDVFDTEPLPEDSPLWHAPGCLITPHVAGVSPRYGERLAELFARNLEAYRGEAEWVNRVV